jgi:hypothetical protein
MVVARLAWPSGDAPFMWAAKYGKIKKVRIVQKCRRSLCTPKKENNVPTFLNVIRELIFRVLP